MEEELPLTCQTTSIVEGCGTTIIASAGGVGGGEMSNNNTSTLVKYIEDMKMHFTQFISAVP